VGSHTVEADRQTLNTSKPQDFMEGKLSKVCHVIAVAQTVHQIVESETCAPRVSCVKKENLKLSLCLINHAPRHEDVLGNGGIDPQFLSSVLDGVFAVTV
jgi:hypothetical protein